MRLKLLAVGQYEFLEKNIIRSVSRGISDNADSVTGFNRIPGPSFADQHVRAAGFAYPLLDAAVVILDVEIDFRMGIEKLKFRDRAVHSDLSGDVSRLAMMSMRRH